MSLTHSLEELLGMVAPDFSLPATDGETYSLSSFAESEVLVVIFMCNHCPYVKAVLPRLNRLAKLYTIEKVRFVSINANDATDYPQDSFAAMHELPLDFVYLYDESQQVAKAYHAVCTPDVFVFDKNRTLVYHGRIDDNWQNENAVTKEELRIGIDAVLAGKIVPVNEQIPSMGCNIKWKE